MNVSIKLALRTEELCLIAASVLDNGYYSDNPVFPIEEAKAINTEFMNKSCKGSMSIIDTTLCNIEKYKAAVEGHAKHFSDPASIEHLLSYLSSIIAC